MTTLRRSSLALAATAGLLVVAGCDKNASAPDLGLVTEASSPAASLRVAIDRAEMRTVDRALVTLESTADPAAEVALNPPRFDAAGWTIVSGPDDASPLLESGRVVRRTSYVIEPFLDGEYVIPPAELDWTLGESSGRVTTEPLGVQVVSVLPDASDARPADLPLAEPRPPVDPAEERGDPAWAWTTLGLVLLGAAGVAAAGLAYLRSRSRVHDPSPLEDALRRLRASANADDRERLDAAAAVAAAVHRDRLAPHDAARLDALLERLHTLRYDPEARPSRTEADTAGAEAEELAARSRGVAGPSQPPGGAGEAQA